MGVATPRKEYEQQLPGVTKNRDCASGQRAVKAKSTVYLKPLASQLNGTGGFTTDGKQEYEQYLSLALYFNAVGRTVDGSTGLIHRKKPVIELPAALEYLRDSIDSSTETLASHIQASTRENFITPRCGLLVDFPQSNERLSVADTERLNIRPKIMFFPYESILNWRYGVVDGKRQLVLLVLVEAAVKIIDKFETETVKNYRVLELIDGVYHSSLYNEDENIKEEAQPIRMNGQYAREIPFYTMEPLGGNRSAVDDLVDVNLNHYNMFSAYANKEHMCGFPIYWETGVTDADDDKNVSVGVGAKWTSENDQASFGILETSGDGGSMRSYLEDRKAEMAALGADMLKPSTSQAESGEAKRLDKIAQNATAGDIANTVSTAYRSAIRAAAVWVNANPDEVKVELNTDYIPGTIDPQMMSQLVAALQSGQISYDTFYENLQKGEIASEGRSAEEELALIASSETGMQ